MLLDSITPQVPDIVYLKPLIHRALMTRTTFHSVILILLTTLPAQAACYADYKAKKDSGQLQLHYGVVQVSDASCRSPDRVEREVRQKIARGGWSLLNVLSVFDESGLEQRKASASDFFLRF